MNVPTCMVVMYHYVRDSASTPFPEIRALAPGLFEQQLDWLQEHYVIVGVADIEAALRGEVALPDRAALLTFDDGFVDHYAEVFPVLRRRGVSGAFFLTQDACAPSHRLLGVHKTHFLLAVLGAEAFGRAVLAQCDLSHTVRAADQSVFGVDRWEVADDRAIKQLLNYGLPLVDSERLLEALFVQHLGSSSDFARRLYLSDAMIREMADEGMVFGYHTRGHRMLSRLSIEEQRAELDGGVEWIRGLTRQTTVPFCYPWGGPQTYTADTLRILLESGYSLAFNTVRRRAACSAEHRFELLRFDTRDLPPYTSGEADAVAAANGEG